MKFHFMYTSVRFCHSCCFKMCIKNGKIFLLQYFNVEDFNVPWRDKFWRGKKGKDEKTTRTECRINITKGNQGKNIHRNWDDRYHVLNVSSFLLISVFNSWLMMVCFFNLIIILKILVRSLVDIVESIVGPCYCVCSVGTWTLSELNNSSDAGHVILFRSKL